jgi:hypothetical protein
MLVMSRVSITDQLAAGHNAVNVDKYFENLSWIKSFKKIQTDGKSIRWGSSYLQRSTGLQGAYLEHYTREGPV